MRRLVARQRDGPSAVERVAAGRIAVGHDHSADLLRLCDDLIQYVDEFFLNETESESFPFR